MDILNLIKSQLGGGGFQQISQQIGSDDSQKTETATTETVNSMMSALQNQVSTPEGAEQLNKAVDQQAESGGMLQSLSGMLGGNLGNLGSMFGFGGNDNNNQNAPQNNDNNNAAVSAIFGNQQQQTTQQISQKSGLSTDIVSKLMGFLAPLVMGFLGTAKKQQGLDANGIKNLIQQQQQGTDNSKQEQTTNNNNQKSGALGFLDQNGDGNVGVDDVTGFFKKLF